MKDKRRPQEKNFDRANSTHDKERNRLEKLLAKYVQNTIIRKHQYRLINEFIKLLLAEGRTTKEELRKYFPRKKETHEQLFGNDSKN